MSSFPQSVLCKFGEYMFSKSTLSFSCLRDSRLPLLLLLLLFLTISGCGKTVTEDERLPHVDMEVSVSLCDGVICPVLEDRCGGTGVCDPTSGECIYAALDNGTRCEDGDVCTVNDTCQEGQCTSGAPRSCQAVSQCHEVVDCDPEVGCRQAFKEMGAACDDQNPCTETSTCNGLGQCIGEVKICPERSCYGPGSCNPASGICEYTPDNQQSCDLENAAPCEVGLCQNGVCSPQPLECPETDNTCQVNQCNQGTGECEVSLRASGSTCNDGDPCTQLDQCSAEGVCAGEAVVCDVPTADADCRANGRCDPLTGDCRYDYLTPDECRDGNLCHQPGVCLSGVCITEPVRCPITSSLQCKIIECNEDTGDCEAIGNQPAVVSCSDDACQLNQLCDGEGTCGAGSRELACPPSDQCNVYEECDAIDGCTYRLRDGVTSCDDGDPCTENDRCQQRDPDDPSPKGYICLGNTVTCPDLNPNNPENFCRELQGSCNVAGECEYPSKEAGVVCNDYDACTSDTTCNEDGECIGTPRDCSQPDDSPECKVWQCVDPGICEDISSDVTNGDPCNDQLFCTAQSFCSDGECTQSNPRDCLVESDYSPSVFSQGGCDEMAQDCILRTGLVCGGSCDVQFVESEAAQTVEFVPNNEQNNTRRQLYFNYNQAQDEWGDSATALIDSGDNLVGQPRPQLILLGGENGIHLLEVAGVVNGVVSINDVSDRLILTLDGEAQLPTRVRGFAVGNLNDDLNEDLIVITSSKLFVFTAFIADDQMKFKLSDVKSGFSQLSSGTLADVDRDGQNELFLGRSTGSMQVFEFDVAQSDGDVSLTDQPTSLLDASGNILSVPVNEVRVLDVNGDQFSDLITCGRPNPEGGILGINLLLNQGGQAVSEDTRFRLNPPESQFVRLPANQSLTCEDLRVADFNLDGNLDFITLYTDRLSIFEGGIIERSITLAPSAQDAYANVPADFIASNEFRTLAIADYDLDGHYDVYVTRSLSDDMKDQGRGVSRSLPDALLMNEPGDQYRDLIRAREVIGDTRSTHGVLSTDINQDGTSDLFVSHVQGQPKVLLNLTSTIPTRVSTVIKLKGSPVYPSRMGVRLLASLKDEGSEYSAISGSSRSGVGVEGADLILPGALSSDRYELTATWPTLSQSAALTQKRYDHQPGVALVLSPPVCEISTPSLQYFCGTANEGCCVSGNACGNITPAVLSCNAATDTCQSCIGSAGCACLQGDVCDDLSLRCSAGECFDCQGENGCACNADNGCNDPTADQCVQGVCESCQGDLDCACFDDGSCANASLRCNGSNLCEACPAGEVGCPCDQDPQCSNTGTRCNEQSICVSCAESGWEAGCSCTIQSGCGTHSLRCDTSVCVDCVGENDCACQEDGSCDVTLSCQGGTCSDCGGSVDCTCIDASDCQTTLSCQGGVCADCGGGEGCTCQNGPDCTSGVCMMGICSAPQNGNTKNAFQANYSQRMRVTVDITSIGIPPSELMRSYEVVYVRGDTRRVVPVVNILQPNGPDAPRVTFELFLSSEEKSFLETNGRLEFNIQCGVMDPTTGSREITSENALRYTYVER